MKSTVENVSQLGRKLNIEIPASEVGKVFDRHFKGAQKRANLKGFRPGKAPMQMIKSLYAESVGKEVVSELIQSHYYEALRAHDLNPVNHPEFEFDVPKEDKEFMFSAHFEIRPEVALKKYEGLELEKEKFKFDDSRVDQVLNNIRKARAQLVDILEDRPAQMEDVAIIDFEGFVKGVAVEGGKGTNHQLELGAHQFIEGFEEGVVGMKVGGEKTLHLHFPDPYHSKELAGQPVEFKVTLRGLKKKELPEMTDEFLKSIGESSTVEQLKETIKNDIERTEKNRIEGDLKNNLLKQLVKLNPLEVPQSMVSEQKHILVNDMKNKMSEQGFGDEEFEQYKAKWDKDFESSAAEMIKAGFIIDAIAEKHELYCSDEDVEKKFSDYSTQTGISTDRVKEFYSQPAQNQRLRYTITEDKVVKFLLTSAKIKEVDKKAK